MFKDRTEAAYLLAERLQKYKGRPVVIMAIPRGGLPLGSVLARALGAPMDVALSKKIGHPYNKEYAIGAVSLGQRVLNSSEKINPEYLDQQTKRLQKQLLERHKVFHRKIPPAGLKGKYVIITDDGIATGNTLKVTISLIARSEPDKIIVAIPVAPPSVLESLKAMPEVDEVICLETPWDFHAVGQFYEDFRAVSDREALRIFEGQSNSDHTPIIS